MISSLHAALALQPQEALLVTGFNQLMDEGGGGGEADRKALLAGGQTQAQRNVGFAGAGIAEGDHVLAALQIFASSELQHERLVKAGQSGEVVAVEALHGRETGRPDPALDQALFPIDHLQLGQAEQIADVIDALGGALPSHLVVLAHKGRQLERLQMVAEQDLRRRAHAARPASRLK